MAWFDRSSGNKTLPETKAEKPQETPKPASEPVPVAAAPQPKPVPKVQVAPQPSTAGLVGYLYKGSRVNGQLNFQGPARIDGVVDGEIQCQGDLTIGEGAEVRAKISGQTVLIRGKVEGNVTAKEKVEIAAPGRLTGNIESPRLVITEGVVFDGDCSMGAARSKAAGAQSLAGDMAAAAPAPKLQADSKN
jgi:cytoskeletal protein CcmA (bactofilin family)